MYHNRCSYLRNVKMGQRLVLYRLRSRTSSSQKQTSILPYTLQREHAPSSLCLDLQPPHQWECKGKESRSGMSSSLRPHGIYNPWNSLGQNTGVASLSLLQGIFPTQESNWGLLHCRLFTNWAIREALLMPIVKYYSCQEMHYKFILKVIRS